MAATVQSEEFERSLRVALSCITDAQNVLKQGEEVGESAEEASWGGLFKLGQLKRGLEREFRDSLEMASRNAVKAAELNPHGIISVDGAEVGPADVLAGVSALRGHSMQGAGKWDDAISHYKQALTHQPTNPEWHFRLGAMYAIRHLPAAATEAFNRAIELDPIGEYGVEAAKLIEKLRAGKLGRKTFTGSWIVVGVLGLLTVLGFLGSIQRDPLTALVGAAVFGGALLLYWRWKYR